MFVLYVRLESVNISDRVAFAAKLVAAASLFRNKEGDSDVTVL